MKHVQQVPERWRCRKDDEDEAEFKGESYILDKEKHELDRRRAASWLRLQDLMVREP